MPKPNILVGTQEIAGFLSDFAEGFRELGYQVITVTKSATHPFYPYLKYDLNLSQGVIKWPKYISESNNLFIRIPRGAANRISSWLRIIWLIIRNDIFLFQWGSSLLPDNLDFVLIKMLGKKIISVFDGDDVRHWSAYLQQYNIDLRRLEGIYLKDPLKRPLLNIRNGEYYADIIFSVPNQAGLAIRPYMHFFIPIKLSEYNYKVPARDIPVVVHAPSVKLSKGTNLILPVLEQLHRDGIKFELRLLHGVSNEEVRKQLSDADVAIDQLYFPLHGKFTVEALASGCAVATCNREDRDPIPGNRPIVHISANNIYEPLKLLLTNQQLRIKLAKDGYEYVKKYHDHINVAKHIMSSLLSKGSLKYDYCPDFFLRDYVLPDDEIITENLKSKTATIIQKWGMPKGISYSSLVTRGLSAPRTKDLY